MRLRFWGHNGPSRILSGLKFTYCNNIWRFWLWELHAVSHLNSNLVLTLGLLWLNKICQSGTFAFVHTCNCLGTTLWLVIGITFTTLYRHIGGGGNFHVITQGWWIINNRAVTQRRVTHEGWHVTQVDVISRVVGMSTWTIPLERKWLRKGVLFLSYFY